MAVVKPKSVWLAYPHGGSVDHCFMESMIALLIYDSTHGQYMLDAKGAQGLYIADNRDLLARNFMRSGAEWFATIDTDIAFEPGNLYKLLESADPVERPIMSALYFGYMSADNKLGPVWYGGDPGGPMVRLTRFTSGVQRLRVAGMGFCVIHRSVFEKFGTRWADTGWLYFGHDFPSWVPKASINNDFTPFGEDNCFCDRAAQLGIPIYGNGDVIVDHNKKSYENLGTYLARNGNVQFHDKVQGTAAGLRVEPGEANGTAGNGNGLAVSHDAGHQPEPSAGYRGGLRSVPMAAGK